MKRDQNAVGELTDPTALGTVRPVARDGSGNRLSKTAVPALAELQGVTGLEALLAFVKASGEFVELVISAAIRRHGAETRAAAIAHLSPKLAALARAYETFRGAK